MGDSEVDPPSAFTGTNKELIVQCFENIPEWKRDGISTPDWRFSRVIFLINFKPYVLELSSPKAYPGTSPDLFFYQGPFSGVCSINTGSASCLQGREDFTARVKVWGVLPYGKVGRWQVMLAISAWVNISTLTVFDIHPSCDFLTMNSIFSWPYLTEVCSFSSPGHRRDGAMPLRYFLREPLSAHQIMLQAIL